ncbi:hypothetical protein [Pseudalkalibacillus sp. SCS-8]|uniref:hypothetical protein n=1 Tax=Pseudalkalibacillus nanhaiensis TaxID=3115291 RepID=UPI0032DB17B3
MRKRILRFLFRLDVRKSTGIALAVSSPWLLYLLWRPMDHATAILWANTALVYFILAFILYLFLRLIGRLGRSEARRRLVIFTRVYIRFHVASAILGVGALLMHAGYMLSTGWAATLTGKTGMVALIALAALLFTGYLRKRKSSGRRRRFHRYTAYLFLIIVFFHVFM